MPKTMVKILMKSRVFTLSPSIPCNFTSMLQRGKTVIFQGSNLKDTTLKDIINGNEASTSCVSWLDALRRQNITRIIFLHNNSDPLLLHVAAGRLPLCSNKSKFGSVKRWKGMRLYKQTMSGMKKGTSEQMIQILKIMKSAWKTFEQNESVLRKI